MVQFRYRFAALAVLLPLVLLPACIFPTPQISLSAPAIGFGAQIVTASFTIRNAGTGTLTWTLEEVTRADADAPWVAQDVPWLSLGTTAGETSTELDRVEVSVSRAGQDVGEFTNAGVRVRSNGGDQVVRVSMRVEATLVASPTLISVSPVAESAEFSLQNVGQETVSWEILYLDTGGRAEDARPLPATIQVNPNPSSTAPGQTTGVTVGFPANVGDFDLLVASSGGSSVVRIRFGATLEGLEATPSPLTLFVNDSGDGGTPGAQAASTLSITNTSGVSQSWLLEPSSRINPGEPPPFSATPFQGSTPPASTTKVAVRITDPEAVVAGSGNYELVLRSGEAFQVIPIVIEIMPLPIITLSEPPETASARPEISEIDFLDFGRDQIQLTFFVANTGTRGSRLSFRITHEDQGVENPLILDVSPLKGDTNGPEEIFFFPPESNLLIDAEAITVTVDRGNMTEDVEERLITVQAFDADFLNPLDVVETQTLRVRVERQPLTIEGAINRSRPPFVNRFVFLMRDTRGTVIPTRTAADLERLQFFVTEDGVPLDLNETSQFITGPGNLRVNLVLMLDFTGSMYRAGVNDLANPLRPGEALAQVIEATKLFLDDLPPSYRVSLMYYNDRQQLDRLIAGFSTDREALKTALDAFSLAPSQFGVSNIRDALLDGIERLAAEDAQEVLPFDDADVRALLYITDGQDNSSATTAQDLVSVAQDNRVRLYPLGYNAGGQVNNAELLVLATETGGHLYSAGNVGNLARLLGNEKGLSVEPALNTGANLAFFKITNVGQSIVTWSVEIEEGVDWIRSVSPSTGSSLVGGSNTIQIRVDPGVTGPNQSVEGRLFITSNSGTAEVVVRMDVGADDSVADSVTLSLRDEPGRVWGELQNQIVLTYITPSQEGGEYNIRARYLQPDGNSIEGDFERDAVFFPGDVLAGQVALSTTGIIEDLRAPTAEEAVRAEIFLRTDYAPRDVNRIRVRFFLDTPSDVPAAAAAALDMAQIDVALAAGGLLVSNDEFSSSWRLLNEGDGIYVMLTERDNALPYGSFGNLLKITVSGLANFVDAFAGLARQPEFFLGMRLDNDIYFSPATPGHPSQTKYFLYPGGPKFPDRPLSVSTVSDVAPPARLAVDLAAPNIDPEDSFAWDRDEDGLRDFNDPFPDNPDLPGSLVFPNPLDIGGAQTTAAMTIRNDRFDTYAWVIDPTSIPSWVSSITFGNPPSPTPRDILQPGESERINITVDRTGLQEGLIRATLRIDTDIFGPEEIAVTLIVPPTS